MSGAMGVVWRATDELLGRTVAMKELLAVRPVTSAAGARESRQAHPARRPDRGAAAAPPRDQHVRRGDPRGPAVAGHGVPAVGVARGRASRGEGPLPAVEAADIGRQMADGLAAAHLAGVVHRDVKPGNVLIAADGLVKLTDFGVSRAVDEVQLTRTGVIAGTPAYLAPEVAQGRQPTRGVGRLRARRHAVRRGRGRAAVRAGRQRVRVAAQGRDRAIRNRPGKPAR